MSPTTGRISIRPTTSVTRRDGTYMIMTHECSCCHGAVPDATATLATTVLTTVGSFFINVLLSKGARIPALAAVSSKRDTGP